MRPRSEDSDVQGLKLAPKIRTVVFLPTTETILGTSGGVGNTRDVAATGGADFDTVTTATRTGNITSLSTSITCLAFGPSAFTSSRYLFNIGMRFKGDVSVTNESDAAADSTLSIQTTLDGGNNWTTIRQTTAVGAGGSATLTLFSYDKNAGFLITFPDGTDLTKIGIKALAVPHGGGVNNDGSVSVRIFGVDVSASYVAGTESTTDPNKLRLVERAVGRPR